MVAPGKVTLIGTGVIGRAWAVVFARAGHEVHLFDSDPEMLGKAGPAVADSIDLLAAEILIADSAEAKKRVITGSLRQALDDTSYVQESVTENVGVKRAVFQELDRLAPPSAILASSASAIPGSEFMDVGGRVRCLVAHPVSPPSLVPLVELVPTPWTDPAVVTRTLELLQAAGQSPVTLKREIEGFVLNRLQAAVISEAMNLVGEGVISPDDLDKTMRDGLGLRWTFMGPFETMDLNAEDGIGGYLRRYAKTFETICRDLKVLEPWQAEAISTVESERRRLLPAEDLGERRRWRDQRLTALLKLRRADNR